MVFQLIFIHMNYMNSKSNILSAPNVNFCLRMTNLWGMLGLLWQRKRADKPLK